MFVVKDMWGNIQGNLQIDVAFIDKKQYEKIDRNAVCQVLQVYEVSGILLRAMKHFYKES